jgi:hypothetical protein
MMQALAKEDPCEEKYYKLNVALLDLKWKIFWNKDI